MLVRYALLSIAFLISTTLWSVTVTVHPNAARCGLNNGQMAAAANGGLPPYTYTWSNGATGSFISGLAPGTYTVTVTDGTGNTAQASAEVVALQELMAPPLTTEHPDCDYQCGGVVSFYENGLAGVAPYSYSFPSQVQWNNAHAPAAFHGACGFGGPPLTISDANGCSVVINLDCYGSSSSGPWVTAITPACGGAANGSAMVSSGPYFLQGPNGLDTALDVVNDVITGLYPGSYTISYAGVAPCSYPTDFTVPNIPEPCGSVSGKIFNDVDRDCVQDAGTDIPLTYRVLTIEPGPAYTITDGAGQYRANVPFGSYTIAQPEVYETQICPAASPAPFTVDVTGFNAVVDMADSSHAPLDVSVYVSCSPLRPGFPFQVWGILRNTSAYPSGDLTLDLTYDAVLGNVIVSPGPISVMAGAIHWELPPIAPYGVQAFSANGTVPAELGLLGTPITFQATVVNSTAEPDVTNNAWSYATSIVGSYDPNDKLAVTDQGHTLAYLIEEDNEVTYTVRFQNTGTASAVNVVVRDTIEEDLDITTLKILGASHAFTPSIPSGRVLQFSFNNIHLPDSGADQRLSHGSISFSLKPRADIAVGDVLTNTAGIYFDFNPPIITNTSVLPVETSTGIAEHGGGEVLLRPNPVAEELTVTVPGASVVAGRIHVLGADGRVVPVPVEARGASTVLDVRALSAGAYLVRYSDGKAVHTARFMKR